MNMLLDFFKKQKKLKMIWAIQVGAKKSYLIGTSHIFSKNFQDSLNIYIKKVENVVLEGPHDIDKIQKVIEIGVKGNKSPLYDLIDKKVIDNMVKKFVYISLDRIIHTVRDFAEIHLTVYYKRQITDILKNYKHWLAFFSLWYEFLDILGWKNYMDMDAFHIAKNLNKNIYFLETIEEQIEAMEGIPAERILNFLKKIENWEDYIKIYEKTYLEGDLANLMEVTKDFPTRCESIIDKRDPILFQRMLPFIEKGNSVILLGITHIPGIIDILTEAGFSVNTISERVF